MKQTPWSLSALACLVALLIFSSIPVIAQTSAFNYQGKLTEGSSAATGTYQMQFALFDASTGGVQIGSTVTFDGDPSENPAIQVVNGVFSVVLDFGATPFAGGQAVYLELRVKKSSENSYTTLTPRQQVVGVPYAQRSIRTLLADLASDSLSLGGLSANDYFLKSGGNISGNLTVSGTSALGSLTVTGLAVGGNTLILGSLTSASLSTGAVSATGNAAVGGDLNVSGVVSGDGSGLTNVASTGSKWSIITTPTPASPNKSYITDGGGEVAVTLPSNPNPGDTVRVMGNLRDTGWKIEQNSGQVVVTNGSDFNYKFEARGDVRAWRTIASSADGMKLVAAVNPGKIYTSLDAGLTWTERMGDADRAWVSVASSADGNSLLAAVSSGSYYFSHDGGENWTASSGTANWAAVGISSDGQTMILTDGFAIFYSLNSGTSWGTYFISPTYRIVRALAVSASGTNILVGGPSRPLGVSGDGGYSFTSNANTPYANWTAAASSADGSRLVAVTNGDKIYTSTNAGSGWSARESARSWSSVASSSDGTKLVAAVNGGKLYSSVDFGNWTALESDRSWSAVTMSADGTRVAAAVNGGQIYVSIPGTTLGATGYLRGAATASIELSYLGNGKWIVVDQAGSIIYY